MAQPYPLACAIHGTHFTLLAPLEPGQVHFTFTGRQPPWMAEAQSVMSTLREKTQEQFFHFQNQDIVWDTTLVTLAHYRTMQPESAQTSACSAFMEIGDETACGRAIRVALEIPRIDEPVILRTIIMIRQYKGLRPGRHVFGEPRPFPTR